MTSNQNRTTELIYDLPSIELPIVDVAPILGAQQQLPVCVMADTPVGLIGRIGEDLASLKSEGLEKGHRATRLPAFVLAAAAQGLDRSRAMVVAIPFAFDHSLIYAAQHSLNGYETAGLAGTAVATTFGAWSWAVGRSFHRGMNSFPKTTKTVIDNHPVMIDVISGAVGGFVNEDRLAQRNEQNGDYTVGPYEARTSKLGKGSLALTRGLKTTFLYGSTAYVGMAKTNGYSDESTHKMRRAVTAESAVTTGSIAIGVSAAVTNNFLGVAQEIRDTVTNKPLLLGVSAGFIGLSTVSNWFSRRSAKKSMQTEVDENSLR